MCRKLTNLALAILYSGLAAGLLWLSYIAAGAIDPHHVGYWLAVDYWRAWFSAFGLCGAFGLGFAACMGWAFVFSCGE